jgi:bacterioferritin
MLRLGFKKPLETLGAFLTTPPYEINMMKTRIIELLNLAVQDELTAIHQYLYFHFHCDDQGQELFANLFKRTAIEEMQHVEKLADRILFLKGDIEMQTTQKVEKIKSAKDMLMLASKMESQSIKEYNTWAKECSGLSDAISRQLFESLAADEERHYDHYQREVDNVLNFGDQYLALQSIERSKLLVK